MGDVLLFVVGVQSCPPCASATLVESAGAGTPVPVAVPVPRRCVAVAEARTVRGRPADSTRLLPAPAPTPVAGTGQSLTLPEGLTAFSTVHRDVVRVDLAGLSALAPVRSTRRAARCCPTGATKRRLPDLPASGPPTYRYVARPRLR